VIVNDCKKVLVLANTRRYTYMGDPIYYMSHQYRNKSKSQLTSPMPAQLAAVALSSGHIVCVATSFFLSIDLLDIIIKIVFVAIIKVFSFGILKMPKTLKILLFRNLSNFV
jgi:hypothetical protein